MFGEGDVLLHVESQDVHLPLETRCHLFRQEMHVITRKVVEDNRDRPGVLEIDIAILICRSRYFPEQKGPQELKFEQFK